MKKIILKIILSIFLLFWFTSLVNANVEFTDINWLSYIWNVFSYDNKTYSLWDVDNMVIFSNPSEWFKAIIYYKKDWTVKRLWFWNWNWILTDFSFVSWIFYNTTTEQWCFNFLSSSDNKYMYFNFNKATYQTFWTCWNDIWDFLINDWEIYINWVLYSWTPEVNQTCEAIFTTDESKFDYNYKEEYTTFIDYIDEDREESLFQYWTDDNKFYISLENAEDITNFSWWIINNWFITYNNLDSPFADSPIITAFSSDNSNVNYFEITWTWSYYKRVYGLNSNWERFEIADDLIDTPWTNFEFNKLYYFPNFPYLYWFEFETTSNSFSDDIVFNLDFWKIVKTQEVHEVCYDEETNENITVDGESYSWSLDDIWKLDIYDPPVENELDSWLLWFNFTPTWSWTIEALTNWLNETFWIDVFTNYLIILLPETPNLSIQFPFLKFYDDLSIWIEVHETELKPIKDDIWINHDEKSEVSKNFISVISWFFYILFRLWILYIVFFIFKLFYWFLYSSIWLLFWKTIFDKTNWNLFSLWIFIFTYILIFSILIWLFSYILELDLLFNWIVDFWNSFFSLIVVSFWDYSNFVLFINSFFAWIVAVIWIFIVKILVEKFWKFN